MISADARYAHAIKAIATSTATGRLVKPTACPNGVSASASAAARVTRDVVASRVLGRLLQVQPQVLMTQMTRIWVDSDSTNQAVRNASGSACKTFRRTVNVIRSNANDRSRITSVKRRI